MLNSLHYHTLITYWPQIGEHMRSLLFGSSLVCCVAQPWKYLNFYTYLSVLWDDTLPCFNNLPKQYRHGPPRLLGKFEQLALLQIILQNPCWGTNKTHEHFGVLVSVCKTWNTCVAQGKRCAVLLEGWQVESRSHGWYFYDLSVMDETGCDKRNTIRKYGYSVCGRPVSNQRLLVRGIRYSAIPVLSLDGIHVAEGTINGDRFVHFLQVCLLPHLPLNVVNPRSVVIMDNASIHHVEEVRDLIEMQAGAMLLFLPPYLPDACRGHT